MVEEPKTPLSAPSGIGESSDTLTEKQTVRFLIEHGFEPIKDFVPGQPILCVLPEVARKRMKGAPHIARFDSPLFFTAFLLNNQGGQIDYFTIQTNGVPKLVNTDFPSRSFAIEKDRIFKAGQSPLFPRRAANES